MSVVTLEEVKLQVKLMHTADDAQLQQLIDDVEDECLQYIDRESLPRVGVECPDECDTASVDNPTSDADDLPRSLRRGIVMMVQGYYEAKDAEEMAKLRRAAETLWHPYRCHLGA